MFKNSGREAGFLKKIMQKEWNYELLLHLVMQEEHHWHRTICDRKPFLCFYMRLERGAGRLSFTEPQGASLKQIHT